MIKATSLLALTLALVATSASARDAVLHLPIGAALAEPEAQKIVGTFPLRFGAASAADLEIIVRDVQIDGKAEPVRENANRRDSQPPSDESVCQKAFEDAMTRLVEAARKAGAVAVVGIVWEHKGEVRDDATRYECHAGSFRSHVALRAQLARTLPRSLPSPTAVKSGDADRTGDDDEHQ